MCGAQMLVASVVVPGARTRDVYLPAGPACWYAFDTGERFAAGEMARIAAPLDRIPMFCPAGAIVPMTDRDDFSRLTDEASRSIRVFPPPGAATSSFTLYEDDGISLRHRDGEFAEVAFTMTTSASEIGVRAVASGAYALPYDRIRVVVATDDPRRLVLEDEGVVLRT